MPEMILCAPRVGDAITYKGRFIGNVTRVEGNLCWHTGDDAGPFIWRFNDGLNALHGWPRKAGRVAYCPGVTP